MRDFYRLFVLPVSILSGTIIGAGVFALPFVFQSAGLPVGFAYIAVLAAVFAAIHLMYADVILRTKGRHRFVGYVRVYLGETDARVSVLTAVVGMTLSLTIYLILAASFIKIFFPALPDAYGAVLFWFFGSVAIFESVRRLAVTELLALWGIAVIIAVIFVVGLAWGGDGLKPFDLDLTKLLLPFGPVVFSLIGRAAIPEVIEYFRSAGGAGESIAGRPIKRAIIWGTAIPAIVYLLFVVGVLGMSAEVSQDIVSSLVGKIPLPLLALIGVLGLASLWSTYIVIGADVKDTLSYDFKLPKTVAGTAIVLAPLFMYLAGFNNFLVAVTVVGGFFVALESTFIVLMWRNAGKKSAVPSLFFKRRHPYFIYFFLALFALIVVYEIIYV